MVHKHFQVPVACDEIFAGPLLLIQLLLLCRPICKDPAAAGRQTSEEKEDHSEEKHPEPLLQRIVQLWNPSGANAGEELVQLVVGKWL